MHYQKRKWTYLFLSTLFLSTLVGCGGGGEVASTNTTLQGTVALNNGQAGTVTLNVNTALATNSRFSLIRQAEAQVGNTTGNCITPTCNLPLSGSFNTTTNTFSVSGSGGTGTGCSNTTTTFNGTYTPSSGTSSGSMSGSITSTSGGTTTTVGAFSGFNVTNTPGATNYCGTFNGGGRCSGGINDGSSCTIDTDCSGGTCSKSDLGVFNVSINGSQLTGSAQGTCKSENPTGLNATVSGNTFIGCSTDPTHPSPICGTISADGSVTGFFKKKQECKGGGTNDGTPCATDTDCTGGGTCGPATIGCFSGSTSGCSANTPPSGCDLSATPCGTLNCDLSQPCP
jgi:hypothetical protein